MRKIFARIALALALIAAPAVVAPHIERASAPVAVSTVIDSVSPSAQALTPAERVVLFSGKAQPVATLDFTTQAYTRACPTFASCVTFSRASQETDSFYTDAAGSSYNTYANNVPVITSAGLQVFEARTQYLTTATSPASETVTLTTGQHTLWAIGTGTATIAAGTGTATGLGTHTPGTPLVFNVTISGTFNISKTGTLNRWQLEKGAFATPFMPGASRAADVAQLTGAALTALQGAKWSAAVEFTAATGAPGIFNYRLLSTVGGAGSLAFGTNTTVSWIGTSIITATLGTGGWESTSRAAFAAATAGGIALVANGGTVVTDAATPSTGAVTSAYVGSNAGSSNFANGWLRSLAVYNVRLPDATLKAKSVVGASYAANDNGVRFAFANDNLPVWWRIAI